MLMLQPIKVSELNIPGEDIRRAYRVGLNRHDSARSNGQRDAGNYRPTEAQSRSRNAMAAVSEYVVSVYAGLPWTAANDREASRRADVGDDIQVRWTDRQNGRLIVHDHDEDHYRCVLVRGDLTTLEIVGWSYAREVKTNENWWDHVRDPAYFAYPIRGAETLKDTQGVKVILGSVSPCGSEVKCRP